jgi:hypothetical protein
LRWHNIQPILEGADSDVVLLLDCCFAGQAARARSYHRVELLAAAAMNLMTPGVAQAGATSFTKALLEQIPHLLQRHSSFSLTTLHREMLRKEAGLVQQPFYAALVESPQGSVVIRPLKDQSALSPRPVGESKDDFFIRVSMFEKPNSMQKDEILKWLTTARPSTVSAVSMERAFTAAQKKMVCGEYLTQMHHPTDRGKKPWLLEVSPGNINELKSSLEMLQAAIGSPMTGTAPNLEGISRIVSNLNNVCETFNSAVGDCVLDMSPTTLCELQEKEELKNAGFADLMSMRLLLLDESSISSKAIAVKVVFPKPPRLGERLRIGKLEGKPVLVEYWYYDSGDSHINRVADDTLHRVERMATLHLKIKPAEFRTLSGKGYVREMLPSGRFGMVYEIPLPLHGQLYFVLADIYNKRIEYVPVEIRQQLAFKMSAAILNFHVIGWLHKGLRSENILLFGTADDRDKLTWVDVDFLSPYIIGFDYSRPDVSETVLAPDFSLERNLYRHPDRWGRPVRFQKKHDIYALVSWSFNPLPTQRSNHPITQYRGSFYSKSAFGDLSQALIVRSSDHMPIL